MALIDAVADLCGKLAGNGWADLFAAHGLDIRKPNSSALAKELARDLPGVRRAVKGFEDFAQEGRRGIEPGFPARSLLYHAVDSPNVLTGADGRRLGYFPTLAEIEAVENYVFGARPPAPADLLEQAKATAKAEHVPAAVVTHTTLTGPVYRFVMFRRQSPQPVPPGGNFRERRVVVNDKRFFFVDPVNRLVLGRRDAAPVWRREQVSFV